MSAFATMNIIQLTGFFRAGCNNFWGQDYWDILQSFSPYSEPNQLNLKKVFECDYTQEVLEILVESTLF